jgi:hypothetical protein
MNRLFHQDECQELLKLLAGTGNEAENMESRKAKMFNVASMEWLSAGITARCRNC